MAIVLYGTAKSRASRSLLALEELGLRYDHRPLHPSRPGERDMLLPLNPNGRIPVLVDEGRTVWESMAINLYLGDRYGGPQWTGPPADRGLLYQWTLWAQTEVDVKARHAARLGPDPNAAQRAAVERLAVLTVLDRVLAVRAFLLGDRFTLADLNVAATLSEPGENGRIDGDFDPRAHGLTSLGRWLAHCTGRPSWARVAELP